MESVTLHDWADIYQRELRRCPPADEFIAGYFKYEAPDDEPVEESEEYISELPDYED